MLLYIGTRGSSIDHVPYLTTWITTTILALDTLIISLSGVRLHILSRACIHELEALMLEVRAHWKCLSRVHGRVHMDEWAAQ